MKNLCRLPRVSLVHMGVKTLDIHVVCVCQPVLSFDMGVHCIDTHVTLNIHVSFSDIGVNHCL